MAAGLRRPCMRSRGRHGQRIRLVPLRPLSGSDLLPDRVLRSKSPNGHPATCRTTRCSYHVHSATTGTPPSARRRIAAICASVCLYDIIQNLLNPAAGKILPPQSLTFGGDYRLYSLYGSRAAILFRYLSEYGFEVSVSGKGNCCDTPMVKTFVKTIRAKQIWRSSRES